MDVRAAGINYADVLIRLGVYPQMPELPGSSARRSRARSTAPRDGLPGERRRLRRAGRCRPALAPPLPATASFAEGAAFPMAFLTAWIPLTELVRIAFGARVLVTAAAGAVGTAAVQIIRALNGHAVAAVGKRREARAPALARRRRVRDVRGDRRARPGRRRLRPRRRRALRRDPRPAQADGHGHRGRLRGRAVAGREPDAGSSAATSASTASTWGGSSAGTPTWSRVPRATSCACGKVARCGPSSEPSFPSRRLPRRIG